MRYQAKLVEHVSDAIIGLDADGRIDSWNPAAEQMYGWTCDAVIGRKFADVVGADPRLGLESAKHLETVHRRSDGTLLEVRISVALVLDRRSQRGHRRGRRLRRHHRAPPLRSRAARARGALHRGRRVARGRHRRQRRPGRHHRGQPRRGEHPRPAHHGRRATRHRVQRGAARPPPRRLPRSPTTSTRPCARCAPASRSRTC